MTRNAVCVASVVVLCLASFREAQAEPIRLTGGSLTFDARDPIGAFSLVGTRRFSVEGFADATEGRSDPIFWCSIFCEPAFRTTITVGGSFTGSAFGGSGTLDGQTYPHLNNELFGAFVGFDLSGMIDLPTWRNERVTITAPVRLDGFFFHDPPQGFRVPIQGSGRVTLNLVPESIGFWQLGAFRYDFGPTATPEPATLTMVGGALVGAAVRARRRRNRKTGTELSTSTPTA